MRPSTNYLPSSAPTWSEHRSKMPRSTGPKRSRRRKHSARSRFRARPPTAPRVASIPTRCFRSTHGDVSPRISRSARSCGCAGMPTVPPARGGSSKINSRSSNGPANHGRSRTCRIKLVTVPHDWTRCPGLRRKMTPIAADRRDQASLPAMRSPGWSGPATWQPFALAAIDVETESAEIDQRVHLFAHVPVLRRVRDDCAEILQRIQEISTGPPGPGALKQQLQTCRHPKLRRQMRHQFQSAGQVVGGLARAEPSRRALGSRAQIMHRFREIAAQFEVARDNGGDLRGLRPIALLEPRPKQRMGFHAACRREPLVEDLLVKRVLERIATGDASVRPLGHAGTDDDAIGPRQVLAYLLDIQHGTVQRPGDMERGKLRSRRTGDLEQAALVHGEVIDLLLDHPFQIARHAVMRG